MFAIIAALAAVSGAPNAPIMLECNGELQVTVGSAQKTNPIQLTYKVDGRTIFQWNREKGEWQTLCATNTCEVTPTIFRVSDTGGDVQMTMTIFRDTGELTMTMSGGDAHVREDARCTRVYSDPSSRRAF